MRCLYCLHFFVYFIEQLLYILIMSHTVSQQFHAALTYLLAKEGRGAQSRLARQQNIDRGYMNAIAKGRKSGAEDIRAKIATHFGMTYADMLTLGRTILEGGDVLQEGINGKGSNKGQDGKPPKVTRQQNGVLELVESKKHERPPLSISEKITKAVAILESEGKDREVLSDLIDLLYEKIRAEKDNLSLQGKIGEMESRIADLERQLAEHNQERKSA